VCSSEQTRAVTASEQLLRSLLEAPGLPTDELLLATLSHALDAREPALRQAYVLRTGKELSRLLRDDYDRLSALVGRLKDRMNLKDSQ